jgi:amidase
MDPFLSALDLAAAIRAKRVSPVEVVDAYLARIDRLDPALNAVTWRRDDAVRAEARAAEQALMRNEATGPFFGVPLPVKDLTFVTGWPITFGSRAGLNHVAGFTSTVIQRYIDAGFLLLCRTNTPEFGIMCVTENHAWGATRNPWDVRRTPGGSSGGAAAAVAAGLAPVAHASDGGGSIRIPASCCGLGGLKPSRGRVSSGPFVSDVLNGGAVEGCVSRTVADSAAIYDVLGAADDHAWYNAPRFERPLRDEVGRPPGRLRIAWSTTPPTGGSVDPACTDAVARTARLLEDLGHDVFEGAPSWPDPTDAIDTFLTLWNTNIAYWPIDDWDAVEPLSAAMRARAQTIDSLTYVRAIAMLQIYSRAILGAWGRDFDMLLTPTIATEPPLIGALYEGTNGDPMAPLMRAVDVASFTALVNVTGQPAISLPLHWTPAGMPIGVQIIGRPWGEAELIRVASQLETAAPWAARRPPLATPES